MARFLRLDVLSKMAELGLVPLFYHADIDVATQIVAAVSRGGAKVIEFTNRGDFAYEVFAELVKRFAVADSEVILGAGSIGDPGTASLYMANGANFIVGSVTNARVAQVCNRRKVPYSPGCGTASEIAHAEELGVEIVKVFPGSAIGGPAFVKSVLGPRPWSRIMPTGGVNATQENIEGWFKAGVTCVGMGSKLISKDLVAKGDFDAITERTAQVLEWIRNVRGHDA